ncbi:DUF1349 domain-containing protein, partial [bacterium]|nr:DUF1349 domain-containing protein [bacterium]
MGWQLIKMSFIKQASLGNSRRGLTASFFFYLSAVCFPAFISAQIQYADYNVYISPQTRILIKSTDSASGVALTEYKLGDGEWMEYEDKFSPSSENEYLLRYRGQDNLGNQAEESLVTVILDTTPAVSELHIGEPRITSDGALMLTPETPMLIETNDRLSGVKGAMYGIGLEQKKTYPGSFLLGEIQQEIFRDEFNAPELNQDWRWERGNAENRALTEERENLIIYTADGSLRNNNQENILLRNMPVYGGRVVETKLEFNPEYEGQEAGIYIYQNADNYIKLVKTEIDNKNYVMAAMEKNGQYSESISIDEFYEKALYLRIRREETNYRLYYSTNALSWFKIKEFDGSGMTAEAGIGACNGIEDIASGARTAAKFDYFSLYRSEQSNLSDGEYALSYYAEDNVGNKEEQKSITVTLDDSPPEIEIVSPVGGGSYIATKDKVNIVFNVSDAGPYNEAAYLTVVDADDSGKIGEKIYVKSGDSIEPLDLPTCGRYKLTVEAIDWAGHKVTNESGSFEALWDIQPPRTELVSGEPKYGDGSNTFVTGRTTYTLTAVDDLAVEGDGEGLGVSSTSYCIDGGSWTVYAGTFSLAGGAGGISPSDDPACAAYWNFDEGAGNVLNDTSGKGNNGTIYGAGWTEGKSGSALSFDGSNDVVKVPGMEDVCSGYKDFSVEFWMKTSVRHSGGVI